MLVSASSRQTWFPFTSRDFRLPRDYLCVTQSLVLRDMNGVIKAVSDFGDKFGGFNLTSVYFHLSNTQPGSTLHELCHQLYKWNLEV